jgi:RNA polymerase sigma-B factor
MQVACVGLVKAVDRFDVERTTAFSSYAVPTMVGELKRYLRDFGWAVHVPRGMQERAAAVQGAVDRLTTELGHSPAASEIARELEFSEEHVLEALEAGRAHHSVSLDAPRPGGDDLDDSPASEALGAEDERFELIELGASIMPALRKLPERDRRTLHLRFVEDMTQSQIAAEIGVSQMHVSRLIRRSLAQVAEATESGDTVETSVEAAVGAA